MRAQRVHWLGAVTDKHVTKSLADIVPSVRPKFDQLLSQASAWGMQPKVRSAGRTCEQQNEQKELGYSQAAMCRSLHIIGHAVDLDLIPSTCATYTKLGEWWEQRGGVWGGRWTQFGPCGDMGHFHWFPGKAQAVPLAICPSDVSLTECKQIRRDYLDKEFSKRMPSSFGVGAGLLMAAVGVGFVWATLRVKPPQLMSNPGYVSWVVYMWDPTSRAYVREWEPATYEAATQLREMFEFQSRQLSPKPVFGQRRSRKKPVLELHEGIVQKIKRRA